jgi:hypothetical protein
LCAAAAQSQAAKLAAALKLASASASSRLQPPDAHLGWRESYIKHTISTLEGAEKDNQAGLFTPSIAYQIFSMKKIIIHFRDGTNVLERRWDQILVMNIEYKKDDIFHIVHTHSLSQRTRCFLRS